MSTVAGMAFCCGVCHEIMGKTGQSENSNPFLVTKCGHLFHFECLNQLFSRSGDNVAWGPKTCPTCKISLIIGTDVIRIFPTITAEIPSGNDVKSQQKKVDELLAEVSRLKTQIQELAKRLEVSFLKERESQQLITKFRKDMESLDAKLRAEMRENQESRSYIDWLNTEIHHLKNNIMSLTNNLMECQHRMQLASPRPFHPFDIPMRPNFAQMPHHQQGPRRNFPPPVFSPFGNPNPGILGPGHLYPNSQGRHRGRTPVKNTPAIHSGVGSSNNLSATGDVPQMLSAKLSAVTLNPMDTTKGDDGNKADSPKLINTMPEDVPSQENGVVMLSESIDNDANENIEEMPQSDVQELKTIQSDVNDNRIEHDASGVGKQSYWKYHCEKCDLSWENRGGRDPLTSFCHGCHKIISPHSQMPIED